MNDPIIISVPFLGNPLYLTVHEGIPYVLLKPLIKGLGLDWSVCRQNLSLDIPRWDLIHLEVRVDGVAQSMVCIPLSNLRKWSRTIDSDNPNRADPRLN